MPINVVRIHINVNNLIISLCERFHQSILQKSDAVEKSAPHPFSVQFVPQNTESLNLQAKTVIAKVSDYQYAVNILLSQ